MINAFIIKNILAEELFGYRICESEQDHRIVEFFYREFLCEKFLYGEPITVPEIRKLLRKKILNFEFIKLDGEVRPARGTTMMKYIPTPDHPKGIRPSSPKVATFYDLDKMAWRSVSQRSKEIVLKKDEETNRPIIVVQDKDKKAVKVKEPEVKKPETPKYEEEPIDELNVGDIRNYLNRNNENIIIEITRISDEGEIFVKELKYGALFKVPENRIKNIGTKVADTEFNKAEYRKKSTANTKPEEKPKEDNMAKPVPGPKIPSRPVVPETPSPEENKPEEDKGTIILPLQQKSSKEPPKEIQEEPGSEELET